MTNGNEFEGRVALVTGGSRGIGRAVCERLAGAGARIAINYRGNREAAELTLQRVRAAGSDGALYQADVSSEHDVEKMTAAIENDLGPVDHLVANAGIFAHEEPGQMRLDTWRKVMSTNVDGVYLPVMALAGGMLERGHGAIVCMASIAALRPRPKLMAYSASKAAVVSFTRSAAVAFAPAVRVNAIAPGLIETDMSAAMDEATRAAMAGEAAMARLGKPEEIADLTAYLLSDRAAFITGQTWIADGGRVMP